MGHGTCFLKQVATYGGPTMRLSRPPPVKNLRAFCVAARQPSFKFAAVRLCQWWMRRGALVRVFGVSLATREAYYLVSSGSFVWSTCARRTSP
jgi:hypothetical protein